MMKKRLLAVLLAVIIFLLSAPTAQCAGGICFIGVNDSVPMFLPEDQAPFYKGNILYVPYTVFNVSPGGVAVSYNADKESLALFTRAKRLVYDLKEGTVTDEATKVSRVDATYKNGLLFISASKAFSHFGLSTTMLTSISGNQILRITDGSQNLDNQTFVRKAETLISIILEQQSEQTQLQQNTETGEKNETETTGPATVYIAITADAVNEQTLQTLDQQAISATFFLTRQQILTQPELVRKIYISGHMIGLTVDREETDYVSALSEANAALDRVLFIKSLMVLLSNGGQDLQQYIVFRDWGTQEQVEEVLKNNSEPQLIVCRGNNASYTIQQIAQSDSRVLKLIETSIIPGVSIR